MAHDTLKKKLAVAGAILAAHGQDDFTRGHISVRVPGKPSQFYMKPHSIGLDEITPASILTIGLDGEVATGRGRRHSEVFIHSEIYRARADVQCVIHSHPPHAIALSASGRNFLPLSQGGALFTGAVGLYDDTIRLIRTRDMGAALAGALGKGRAVLLKHHGVAVVGASIEEATISAIMLENAARIQLLAQAARGAMPDVADKDVAQLQRDLSQPEQFAINFDYLARRMAKRR